MTDTRARPRDSFRRLTTSMLVLTALGACAGPIDFDLRGQMGGSVDTSEAALTATADRPNPDSRGIISYPSYQVAVARRGDTIADVAGRVGLPAAELARYNGIQVGDPLRRGEIIALPRRVAEPSQATGSAVSGPIRPSSEVDVTMLAAGAIDRAAPTPVEVSDIQTGVEPVRHKVARGETAFTIARLYNVSPRSLAEWNALDRDFSIREGQFLLIPAAEEAPEPVAQQEARVIEPGAGSPTPVPPSAARPLPAATPPPAQAAPSPEVQAKPEEKPPVADIGQDQAKPSDAPMIMPVSGSIIREYAKGRSNGIAISAAPGTEVKAAASGKVLHVGKTAENVEFLLVQHPEGLITAYMFVDDIAVGKGDAVSRGQKLAGVAPGDPSFIEFQVRQGVDSVDPMRYLQ